MNNANNIQFPVAWRIWEKVVSLAGVKNRVAFWTNFVFCVCVCFSFSLFLYTLSFSLASFTNVSRQIKARFYILITTGRGEGESCGGGGDCFESKLASLLIAGFIGNRAQTWIMMDRSGNSNGRINQDSEEESLFFFGEIGRIIWNVFIVVCAFSSSPLHFE